tara:strand:+ start:313 stop:1290 length:978 start_codon:yes stop_codon:yes gene_type:complete
MLTHFQLKRLVTVIKKIVNRTKLSLSGLTIITECATGIYACTPVIALLAGAKKVICFGNDSHHGTFSSAKKDVIKLVQAMSLQQHDLIVTEMEEVLTDYLKKAEIVTNSGHLRPLDKKKLVNLKKNTVIPLMYESWEFRKTDIDLAYCKEKSILVAGTNERHPDINVFNYIGLLIAKVLLNSSMEIIENKYLIVCDNDFAECIEKSLLSLGAEVYYYPDRHFTELDGIIFAHTPSKCGGNLEIDYGILPKDVSICIHVWGDVNRSLLDNVVWYPEPEQQEGYMGISLSDIGIEAIVRLQTGGLKVAELLLKNETDYGNVELAQLL